MNSTISPMASHQVTWIPVSRAAGDQSEKSLEIMLAVGSHLYVSPLSAICMAVPNHLEPTWTSIKIPTISESFLSPPALTPGCNFTFALNSITLGFLTNRRYKKKTIPTNTSTLKISANKLNKFAEYDRSQVWSNHPHMLPKYHSHLPADKN